MPVVFIDLAAADIVEDPIPSVTREGITVRFQPPARLVRFDAHGVVGRGVANGGQNQHDETNQNPMVLEFDRPQKRVRVRVGLEDLDLSVDEVVAVLHAHDADGQEVATDSRVLGRGPRQPDQPLEVLAAGDVIQRVYVTFSGLLRELLGDVELESDTSRPALVDADAPIVRILHPVARQVVTDTALQVRGVIEEASDLDVLELNGAAVAVRRTSPTSWEFNDTIALADDAVAVDARAVDAAGNLGTARVDIELRVPADTTLLDVRFSQTGLFDGDAMPSRRVAGKTALVRVVPRLRTRQGRPVAVDSATVRLEGGGSPVWIQGHRPPAQDGRFPTPGGPYQDETPIYFFIEGRHLQPGIPYRLVLRLGSRVHVALEQDLATDWWFRAISGLTMLLVPQHRAFTPAINGALLQTLHETARMYPVPDGVANLDSDFAGGVRFAVVPPTSYTGHTDPADAGWTHDTEIAYDQGFLLVDHVVVTDEGPDTQWATIDDPTTFWAGEVLPINFVASEDANRDGVISEEDRRRTIGGAASESTRRVSNWGSFVREQAESARQQWNRAREYSPSRRARRAIALITRDGSAGQNRTGWAGNAGFGETSFWADVDTGVGCFLPHEIGHTYGLGHADDGAPDDAAATAACQVSGEAVNLLSRRIVTAPSRLMCSSVGASPTHFFSTTEYDMLFDVIAARGGD